MKIQTVPVVANRWEVKDAEKVIQKVVIRSGGDFDCGQMIRPALSFIFLGKGSGKVKPSRSQ